MEKLAQQCKALGDATRLRIVHLLSHRQLCVCQLMEALDISQAKASRHLAVLRQAELASCFKQAQWVWYKLKDNALTATAAKLAAQTPQGKEDLNRMENLDPELLCATPNLSKSKYKGAE